MKAKIKLKIMLLFTLTMGISLTSLSLVSKMRETEHVQYVCDVMNDSFDEFYNKYRYKYNNKLDKENYSIQNQSEFNDYSWENDLNTIYLDLTDEEKNTLLEIKNSNEDFELAYSLFTKEDDSNYIETNNANGIHTCLAGVVALSAAVINTINSFLAGMMSASFFPWGGWIIAGGIALGLVIYIVYHWQEIKPHFDELIENMIRQCFRLTDLIKNIVNKVRGETANIDDTDSLETAIDQNDDYKKRLNEALKEAGKTLKTIEEIICAFLGVKIIEELYKNSDKTLVIGRDITEYAVNKPYLIGKGYNNIADEYGYFRFFSSNYGEMLKLYGQGLITLANEGLVIYCCYENWTFICATHPYMYNKYIGKTLPDESHGGYGYRMEIATIKSSGYNNIDNKYSWDTLPAPTLQGEDAWWETSEFVVTK